jgi:hypothetical protein
MKRFAVLIVILISAVATGCAAVPAHATDTALTQRSLTPPVSLQTVVVNCLFKQQTRPSEFILTCADAGDVLADLHWVSWGPTAAFATGTEQINDCTPDCAAGKFIDYPVLVNLWRAEPLRGQPGTLYFSRVTRVYTSNRPPQYNCNGTNTTCYPETSTFDLWS